MSAHGAPYLPLFSVCRPALMFVLCFWQGDAAVVRGTPAAHSNRQHWREGAGHLVRAQQVGRLRTSCRNLTQFLFLLIRCHNPFSNRKLFLYSAHDTTLIPCLMALGVFNMKWPPYAADITLELHEHRQTKKAFVKVSYLGQVWRESVCMSIQQMSCLPPPHSTLSCVSFHRINIYLVAVESTAP